MNDMGKLIISLLVLLGPLMLTGQNRTEPELVVAESDDQFGAVRWQSGNQDLDKNSLSGNALLRVYAQDPALHPTLPAVLGNYNFEDDALVFRPRFPFLAGRTYWVWYDDQRSKGNLISIKVPERRKLKTPQVVTIYPSTETWPANQLKFYIHFDQPMHKGFQLEALKIYDDQGHELEAPILDMAQELWDQEQKRLTVWFDPGRIKSLLIPNQQKGPPLKPNKIYQLVVKKEWPAANGLQLESDYIKHFRTAKRDTQKPDPGNWKISAPKAGTRQPLKLHFFESMDNAMLRSGIAVLDAQSNAVKGKLQIGEEERSWSWVPEQAWTYGTYQLRISTDLEDLAGNNLIRLFDTPVEGRDDQQVHHKNYIDLPVEVK